MAPYILLRSLTGVIKYSIKLWMNLRTMKQLGKIKHGGLGWCGCLFDDGQFVHPCFFSEIKHESAQRGLFRGIKFGLLIRGEQLLHHYFGASVGIQTASFLPVAHGVAVDHIARQMLFLAEELHGNSLLKKITTLEVDVVIIKASSEGFGMEFHTFDHALCHGNAFCIDNEFFCAM